VDLLGANILLAGATGGLGTAIGRQLTDAGARLTLVSRDAARLDACTLDGRRQVADLRSPAGAEAAVAAATQDDQPIDVVVNAVGVVAFGAVNELSSDALEELFLTNVFATVFLSQAAIGHMAKGGAMVNISGVIAEKNLPGMAAYGASKAAIRAFGEGFGREARRAKVRLIDARPPHTETGLADRAIEGNAPNFPEGLTPHAVAATIVAAIADDTVTDLPSSSFS
jgi:short-subunit dehydrogenase